MLRAALTVLLLAYAPVAMGQTVSAAPAFSGTWDLSWTMRNGTSQQRGYLVLRQQGQHLFAAIHGRGELTAEGEANGQTFELHGQRMLVPFHINGRLEAGRLVGSLQTLSISRRFSATRRP